MIATSFFQIISMLLIRKWEPKEEEHNFSGGSKWGAAFARGFFKWKIPSPFLSLAQLFPGPLLLHFPNSSKVLVPVLLHVAHGFCTLAEEFWVYFVVGEQTLMLGTEILQLQLRGGYTRLSSFSLHSSAKRSKIKIKSQPWNVELPLMSIVHRIKYICLAFWPISTFL